MADVFISYHHDAEALVQKIADSLKTIGISCWYMGRDSTEGAYQIEIPKAIKKCSVFLLILDKNSNHSTEVLKEVNLAERRKKNGEHMELLIFQVDDCDFYEGMFAYALNPYVRNKGNPPDAQHIQQLTEQITKILGKQSPKQDSKPQNPQIIDSGFCGDNVTYTLDENGVLTIFGHGHMIYYYDDDDEDESDTNAPWLFECHNIFEVYIENGVTSIDNGAFYDCTNLISVTIPESVTHIGRGAFENCTKLSSIVIPSKVDVIEDDTFLKCVNLSEISMPQNICSIGDWAFDGCSNLSSISIPEKVTSIRKGVFRNCASLRNITIPKGVTSIRGLAFNGCVNLTNLYIPDSVTQIADDAFSGCTRLTISVPKRVRIRSKLSNNITIRRRE